MTNCGYAVFQWKACVWLRRLSVIQSAPPVQTTAAQHVASVSKDTTNTTQTTCPA